MPEPDQRYPSDGTLASPLGHLNRTRSLAEMRDGGVWDVMIIGGGATGLGAAVDAASRGLRTLLLERDDFAKGTSSRSTKLVHGGIRYLKQGRVKMVMKALEERDLLRMNAPHLVALREFIVPCRNMAEMAFYGSGLKVYNILASGRGIPPSRILRRNDVISAQEGINDASMMGGVSYVDGQFDDARLALVLAQTCVREGGTVVNHCGVTHLSATSPSGMNVRARDTESGEEFSINARCVVNATGVFADAVRTMDGSNNKSLIRASQGIHLVLPSAFLPGDAAIMVPRTDDGRVLFCIPWKGHVLLGTTDTPVERIESEPKALEDEISFLIGHAGRYLRRAPTRADVLSVFVGLRPLIGSSDGPTKSLSREHVIHESASGLITIAGGKWTTYRHMAEKVVDRVCKRLGASDKKCVTRNLPLYGHMTDQGTLRFGEYGTDHHAIVNTIDDEPNGSDRLHPDLPYVAGQVTWAVENEMARTVEDVLARRTRALFFNAQASKDMAPRVAQLMADHLNQTADWIDREVASFNTLASQYQLHA